MGMSVTSLGSHQITGAADVVLGFFFTTIITEGNTPFQFEAMKNKCKFFSHPIS